MSKQKAKFRVYAPLSNFSWSGQSFQIGDFGIIEKLDHVPDLSWCEHFLSEADKGDIEDVSCWLSFEQAPSDKLSPSEKINIFLLALWLTLPTYVQVRFRFEMPRDSGNGQLSSAARYYDQFHGIRYQAKNQIGTKHLQKLKKIVDKLSEIYVAPKRLWNSLVLTMNGCSTIHWQVAFICFSAAAEGILTYEKGYGITERLAKSFACLIKKTKKQRDTVFLAFKRSYVIRSDIMHGRIAYSTMRGNANLAELRRFSNLLRKLWKVIVSSQAIIDHLEKNDNIRKDWFHKIEYGYKPPKT